MSEKVSVLIPLYNRKKLVQETVASVQAQTYSHWEVIIIDDGSTDGSLELAQAMEQQDARIRAVQRDREPKGAPTCRNIGAELATGTYLIFLDSDDLLAPFCLERRVAAFRRYPAYDFLVFPMLMFQQEPYDSDILWNVGTQEDDLARFLRGDAVWQTSGPIYRKSSFTKGEGFQEGLSFWQDYELHTRTLIVGSSYRKFLEQEPDCFYRQHLKNTISQVAHTKEERLNVMVQVCHNLYSRLQFSPFNTSTNRRQVGAMLFWINMVWIRHHQDPTKCRENWFYCYQQKTISLSHYAIGNVIYALNYAQIRINKANLLFRAVSKFWILLLPRVYRHRSVTILIYSRD